MNEAGKKNWTLKIKSNQIKSNPIKKNSWPRKSSVVFLTPYCLVGKNKTLLAGGKKLAGNPAPSQDAKPISVGWVPCPVGEKHRTRDPNIRLLSLVGNPAVLHTQSPIVNWTIKMLGGDRPAALWPRSPWRRQPPQNPPRGCWRPSPAPPPAATGGDNMKRAQRFRTNPREASLLLSSLRALRGPKKILCLPDTGYRVPDP